MPFNSHKTQNNALCRTNEAKAAGGLRSVDGPTIEPSIVRSIERYRKLAIRTAMSASFLVRSRQQFTRARHRFADCMDVAAFALCPLDSWSTQLHLPALTASSADQKIGGRVNDAAIDLTIDQWTALGSGGFVWNGARRLAAILQQHGDGQQAQPATFASDGITMRHPAQLAVVSRPWAGLNVIELGAGTGILGIAVAALGANVTLTDQATFVYPRSSDNTDTPQLLEGRSLLDLLKSNAKRNLDVTQEVDQQNIQVHEMLWGSDSHYAALQRPTFDVIIAADVLLFSSAHQDLLDTLQSLSTPDTVILIQHTDRSASGEVYPGDMLDFLTKLEDDNTKNADGRGGVIWNPQIIYDHGRHITLRISRQQHPTGLDQGVSAGISPSFKLEDLPVRQSSSSN